MMGATSTWASTVPQLSATSHAAAITWVLTSAVMVVGGAPGHAPAGHGETTRTCSGWQPPGGHVIVPTLLSPDAWHAPRGHAAGSRSSILHDTTTGRLLFHPLAFAFGVRVGMSVGGNRSIRMTLSEVVVLPAASVTTSRSGSNTASGSSR